MCPDGVLFRPLGDLVDYEQPGKYLVDSAVYSHEHATPVLTAGKTFILGYTDETIGIYQASEASPVVIFDDFTTALKWVDFPFKAKSSAMKMLTAKDDDLASLRFIYFAMQTIEYGPQDHARQWIGTYSRFRIPVPPMEVQREVVRILDQFTLLEAALRSDLSARRRQYAFYRDSLLSPFDSSAAMIPMGDIGTFARGRRFTKDDLVDDGIPSIHYGEIYTRYGVSAETAVSRVRSDLAKRLRYAQQNDVVIAAVGETVEDVGKAVAWLGEEPVAIHDDTFLFRSAANPKYVSYCLQTADFHAQKNKYVARAKVKRLSGVSLAKIRIPVPTLDRQERIVEILDKFDAVVSDPVLGLPAEIAARRKQYEYYRNRLMTFQEIPHD